MFLSAIFLSLLVILGKSPAATVARASATNYQPPHRVLRLRPASSGDGSMQMGLS